MTAITTLKAVQAYFRANGHADDLDIIEADFFTHWIKDGKSPQEILAIAVGQLHWCPECALANRHDDACSRKDYHSV